MGFRTETVTKYFAMCDWCGRQVETYGQPAEYYGYYHPEPVLPTGWERDWYADKVNPPIYCSEDHQERARQVAELRKLP